MTSAVQTTYSVTVNTAIDEYNKHIGFLAKTYGDIEGAKGQWHVRWCIYQEGKFPSTERELDETLRKELDTYENLAKATEQSIVLLTLFRNTIEYCTRSRISKLDYETLERRGYKITPSMEGEDVLPQICTHLENLFDRINTIKLHMTDRLPKAAVNLNGIFKEVSKHRKAATWQDAARNIVTNNYLEKALEQKRSSEQLNTTSSSAISTELKSPQPTTPEAELASLGEILEKLKTLSNKDPLENISIKDPINAELPPKNTSLTASTRGQNGFDIEITVPEFIPPTAFEAKPTSKTGSGAPQKKNLGTPGNRPGF